MLSKRVRVKLFSVKCKTIGEDFKIGRNDDLFPIYKVERCFTVCRFGRGVIRPQGMS